MFQHSTHVCTHLPTSQSTSTTATHQTNVKLCNLTARVCFLFGARIRVRIYTYIWVHTHTCQPPSNSTCVLKFKGIIYNNVAKKKKKKEKYLTKIIYKIRIRNIRTLYTRRSQRCVCACNIRWTFLLLCVKANFDVNFRLCGLFSTQKLHKIAVTRGEGRQWWCCRKEEVRKMTQKWAQRNIVSDVRNMNGVYLRNLSVYITYVLKSTYATYTCTYVCLRHVSVIHIRTHTYLNLL